MTGQADDIAGVVGGIVSSGCGGVGPLLEAVESQELLVADGGIGFPNMGIMAGSTLDLSLIGSRRAGIFKFELGFDGGRADPDQGRVGAGVAQFAVTVGQGVVVGNRNRVIVADIGAEVARETGGGAGAGRHSGAPAG